MNTACLCIFGEVLFDHFPDGKRVLGGAPFNVAWHLQAFAQPCCFHSRVGKDDEGEQIKAAMQQWGMNTSYLQIDPERSTGKVNVIIRDNEPTYDIVQHCAYDAIEPVSTNMNCKLLYHGSLALREARSRAALESLKEQHPGIVFVDVNLRPPWWQADAVGQMLQGADWVKLNTDELEQLSSLDHYDNRLGYDFISRYQLTGLVITHGARGAEILLENGDRYEVEPGMAASVIDTGGAGDALTSIIILGLSLEWPLQQTLERAQQFASAVVGQRGATINDPAFYQPFINEWL